MKKGIVGIVLGALLLALCSSAGAQQLAKVPRIGFLSASTLTDPAFLGGLRVSATLRAKTLSSSTDTPRANLYRLPELAVELVRLKVDLIVAQGTPAGLAAKKATSTIPIVATSGDPLVWPCCQPRASWRQRYRIVHPRHGSRGETAGGAEGDSA